MAIVAETRVDWLSAVFDFDDAVRLFGLMDWDYSGDSPYNGYTHRVRGPFGMVADVGEGRALVQCNGRFWASLENWRATAIGLLHAAIRVNRCDLCRDYELGDVVPELRVAVLEGRVSGSHNYRVMGNGKGQTVYMGSRQSDVMLRCYDCRGVDRVELEVKGDTLARVVDLFLAKGRFDEAFSALIGRWRVHQKGGSHRTHSPALEWWQKICACWAGLVAPVRAVRVELSSERVKAWLERAVVPSLREAVDVFGLEWLLSRLEAAPASGRLRRACVLEASLALREVS